MLALVAMPTALASYRENRVLVRMRTTPVPPSWVPGAQLLVNLLLLLAGLLVILGAGAVAFGAHPPRQAPGFLLALVLAVAAMFRAGDLDCGHRPQRPRRERDRRRAVLPAGVLRRPVGPGPADVAPAPPGQPPHAHERRRPGMQNAMLGHFPSALSLLVLAAWPLLFGTAAVSAFRWE
jgi:ABC-2 type transport system permease protein